MLSVARRRQFGWIACLAVLLNALAPGVSHALAARGGDRVAWSPVCTVAGVRWVLAGDERRVDHRSSDAFDAGTEHCPFCATHAGSFGLAPVALKLFVPTAATYARPALHRCPAPHPHAALHARPRAPPESA
jgi:hypothetical protein